MESSGITPRPPHIAPVRRVGGAGPSHLQARGFSTDRNQHARMPESALTQSIDVNGLTKQVSHSLSLSSSPTKTFHPSPSWSGPPTLGRKPTNVYNKPLKPFREEDHKILLLENINQIGKDILNEQGYQVEALKTSLPEDQLIDKIR